MIPVATFAGKKVGVFGLGGSGLASASALFAGGAVFGPGVGMLPRTPQNVICISSVSSCAAGARYDSGAYLGLAKKGIPVLVPDLSAIVVLGCRTALDPSGRLRPGALQGRLDRDVLYAPKRGFGSGIQENDVLRGPWRASVDEAFRKLERGNGPLRKAGVGALKAGFDAGAGVSAMLIAKLYALQEATA